MVIFGYQIVNGYISTTVVRSFSYRSFHGDGSNDDMITIERQRFHPLCCSLIHWRRDIVLAVISLDPTTTTNKRNVFEIFYKFF